MKVYPSKNQQINRYKKNLNQIAKISNYQPIPSIPELSQDFNFTFLIKDYDYANPFLKKGSLNRVLMRKKDKELAESSFQENLLSFSPLGKFNSGGIHHKKQQTQRFKLPTIKSLLKSTKDELRASNQRQNSNSDLSSMKKNKRKNQNMRYNKSATIDTRMQTEQMSLLQQGSAGLLLQMQTKSQTRPIQQGQEYSSLIISKISDRNEYKGYQALKNKQNSKKNGNFVQRNDFNSRNLSEISRIVPASKEEMSRIVFNPELIEQELSLESQQSEEEQYVKNSVPGPGYYSISNYSSFSTCSSSTKNQNSSSGRYSFGSSNKRFSSSQTKQNSTLNIKEQQDRVIEYQKIQKLRQKRLVKLNQKPKKIIPFNCQQQKPQKDQNTMENMISPVYYNPRHGIQEELIKKIQRNFKGSFGVGERRFRTIYKRNDQVGPGSYMVGLEEDQNYDNPIEERHYFKSKKERFQ